MSVETDNYVSITAAENGGRTNVMLCYTPLFVADQHSSVVIGDQVRAFLQDGHTVIVKVVPPNEPIKP